MVGWLGVKLKGKNNQPITFRFSEILNPDTTLYVANLRSAKVTDVYTPAADGEFSWQPSFVYHGFRYVEVSGLDYQPSNRDSPVMWCMMQCLLPVSLRVRMRW